MATPQVQNNPIYPLPYLYIQGLNISYASPTLLAIAPGCCRDSTNSIDIVYGFQGLQGNTIPSPLYKGYTAPLIINSQVNGVNGLDIGTLVSSTIYGVYMIADSRGYNPVAGLLSHLAQITPIMPNGYDSLRLIGFVDPATGPVFDYSVHKPQNMKNALTFYNIRPINVLMNGNVTGGSTVDLSVNGAVPTTSLLCILVWFYVIYTPAKKGNRLFFRYTSSNGDNQNNATIIGQQDGIAQTQYISAFATATTVPLIDYFIFSSADTVSLYVAAWTGVSPTAYPALV